MYALGESTADDVEEDLYMSATGEGRSLPSSPDGSKQFSSSEKRRFVSKAGLMDINDLPEDDIDEAMNSNVRNVTVGVHVACEKREGGGEREREREREPAEAVVVRLDGVKYRFTLIPKSTWRLLVGG